MEWKKWFRRDKQPKVSKMPKLGGFKIHVPGLRFAKRGIAAILLIINFFIAQSALLSTSATQPLYWMFLFNAFIMLDYLWKTRGHQAEQPKKWGEK